MPCSRAVDNSLYESMLNAVFQKIFQVYNDEIGFSPALLTPARGIFRFHPAVKMGQKIFSERPFFAIPLAAHAPAEQNE